MKYEVTITVDVHPEAAFVDTDDEMDNVYGLIESAVFDIDDLILDDLEVREHG
jgi:hypothetical protein